MSGTQDLISPRMGQSGKATRKQLQLPRLDCELFNCFHFALQSNDKNSVGHAIPQHNPPLQQVRLHHVTAHNPPPSHSFTTNTTTTTTTTTTAVIGNMTCGTKTTVTFQGMAEPWVDQLTKIFTMQSINDAAHPHKQHDGGKRWTCEGNRQRQNTLSQSKWSQDHTSQRTALPRRVLNLHGPNTSVTPPTFTQQVQNSAMVSIHFSISLPRILDEPTPNPTK